MRKYFCREKMDFKILTDLTVVTPPSPKYENMAFGMQSLCPLVFLNVCAFCWSLNGWMDFIHLRH
jgi:hypothetical protein